VGLFNLNPIPVLVRLCLTRDFVKKGRSADTKGFRLFSSCPIQSVKLEDEVVEYPCPPHVYTPHCCAT
jgi:hypothetical protein